MHDPPFLCPCLTPRSAPVGVARVTAEATGVSAQAQHPVHLRDGPDHTGVVACLLRFPRRALQASDALEHQVTLIDVVVPKGHIHPLFVGIGHDTAGVSAGAPPCFGHKGSKFTKTDALVDLFHRPFVAMPLLVLGYSFASHGYLPGSDSDLVKNYLQPAATFALALAIASLPFTLAEAKAQKLRATSWVHITNADDFCR